MKKRAEYKINMFIFYSRPGYWQNVSRIRTCVRGDTSVYGNKKAASVVETAFIVSAMTKSMRVKPTSECDEPALTSGLQPYSCE